MNTGCLACSNVYFDQLSVQITKGNLLEENHYYPFGLPIKTMSSVASGALANRHKYQGNEYKQEQGLNWMDFQARQYDPQLGRFLSVDPLAGSGGQEIYSPYAAMGNAPEMMVDPNGEEPMKMAGSDRPFITPFGMFAPTSFAWQGMGGIDMAKEEVQHMGLLAKLDAERAQRDAQAAAATTGGTTSSTTQGNSTAAGNNMATPTGNSASGGAAAAALGASVNGISVREFPASGIYTENNIVYDLRSFDKFYEDFKDKYIAKHYGEDPNRVNLTTDVSDVLIEGKPGNWYAEVGSLLSTTELKIFLANVTNVVQ